MDFFISIYNTIFYEPLLNGFVFLVGFMPAYDAGLAVIGLTLVVKFILFPLSHIGSVNQLKMRYAQKEISAAKEKIKDKAEQAREIMRIYKAHGLNPFSGCLLVLVQIPILIALWSVFWKGLQSPAGNLYSFIQAPEQIGMNFLGLINLQEPNIFLGVAAGLAQFFQMRLLNAQISEAAKMPEEKKKSFEEDFGRIMSLQMTYMLPFFIFFASLKFSAAVPLYWLTMTIFAIIHENWVKRKIEHDYARKQRTNSGDYSNSS